MLAVATAWTDQDSGGVRAIEPRPPASVGRSVREAIDAARRGGRVIAVKVGMVANPTIAAAIVDALGPFDGPVVVDPVLFATRGGSLYQSGAPTLLPLLRRATLATPNAPEAAALSGVDVCDARSAEAAARVLRGAGLAAVLVKGGHLPGDPVDVLVTNDGSAVLPGARIAGASPRGTGCALASAIAIELGRGARLGDAVTVARDWLRSQIAGAVEVSGEIRLP